MEKVDLKVLEILNAHLKETEALLDGITRDMHCSRRVLTALYYVRDEIHAAEVVSRRSHHEALQ